MKKLIELKDVTFGYYSQPVLEKIDLSIFERDCLLILGPNGGGKTTLLKLIMGIDQPWRGSVLYGEGVSGRIGYVPQSSEFNRNFPITVLEMVSTGCISGSNFLKPSKKENRAKAEEAIRRMDLFSVQHNNINDLSGGQLQRMLIARALVSDPALLLLDEPTTSIDMASRINLLDFIRDLNEITSIVVVTHDPTPFAQVYRHIACVNRNLFYHDRGKLSVQSLEQVYGCPVELLGHGIPHVFLHDH